MKVHTTNYFNTLIEPAEDCPVSRAEIPQLKGEAKPVAFLQFEMLIENPYSITSDELLFSIFAQKNHIPASEWEAERKNFFSKGQACLRCSPLTKKYGWGIHSNEEGKIALIGCDTDTFHILKENPGIKKVKAMKSKKG